MRPADFDIQKVIDYLQGTCNTMQEAIETFHPDMTDTDLTSDDWDTVNDQIFLCEQCNWWCETSDRSTDEEGECDTDICTDCEE